MINTNGSSLGRLRAGDPVPLQQYFSDIKAAYALGSNSRYLRRRGNMPVGGAGADYHLGTEAQVIQRIETAQDIANQDIIVGSAIRGLAANVLHGGFQCDHDTGSSELDKRLKDKWLEWSLSAEQCDVEQEDNLHEISSKCFQSTVIAGDELISLTDEDNLQTFEAHRLRNPAKKDAENKVMYGVEMDDRRVRLRYWVTESDDGNSLRKKVMPLEVRDKEGNRVLLHMHFSRRRSASRGVTALVPVGMLASQHDDINFAKLVQQQIVSCYAILRERKYPPAHGKPKSPRAKQGAQTEDPASPDGFRRLIEKLYPGMEVVGDEGEELKGFSPNVPNVEYFDHVRLMLTYIAVNLDLPLILLLMDASQTNFSGWRGAVDQCKLRLQRKQELWRDRFYSPIYRWRVRRWLEDDEALMTLAKEEGVAVYGHHFQLPAWPYVQPVDDVTADMLQVRNAMNSPRRIQAARQRDWPAIVEELVADNTLMITRAIEEAAKIRKRFPEEKVDWREVMSLPTPDQISATLRIGEDQQ